ncbi:GAF domain-containing sensor histidine kinase [Paracnuella aquatica]|uniref:GAF domain-containing sensor histidine kinase n=1 Tax=Paracnuella aquatica TaxID=2268757 RepID=UPI000DEEE139|nr:GAF domain-containing protein [Paracnuella aquatica]RPD44749.1 GAF domain-containing protein [Paracnuella aquatica]
MITPTVPASEERRLHDLYSYEILDTFSETGFDELVELASQICNCPVSLITFIDKDRQWYKAKKGVDGTESPRDIAFCSHAILQDDVFTINDTISDDRFAQNPFVTGGLKVRFYAGAPIVSAAGNKLGTICLIDSHPRQLTTDQKKLLSLLAKQASRLLETHKKNKLVQQQAEELVALKTTAFRKLMQEHAQSNGQISYNLHEEIGQTLASSIMYLRCVETQQPVPSPMLATAIAQLEKSLTDVRKLSYDITPPTLQHLQVKDLLQDFLQRVHNTYAFNISFKAVGANRDTDTDITVLVIRVLKQWLQVLAQKSNATEVVISLEQKNVLELSVSDNGDAFDAAQRAVVLSQNMLAEKVSAYNGKLYLAAGNEPPQLHITFEE